MILGFLAVGVPALLIAVFNFYYRPFPTHDEAEYILLAQQHLLNFKLHGFIEGFTGLYSTRLWKPTSLPVLELPFLILAGGDVRNTAALIESLVALATLTASYWILRRMLTERAALIGTWIFGFYSWFIAYSHLNSAQMPMLACLAFGIYFVIRWFESQELRFALWSALVLALGATIRPVEIGTMLAVPVAYFVFVGLKNFSKHRWVWLVAILACGLTGLLMLNGIDNFSKRILFGVFFAATVFYFAKFRRHFDRLPTGDRALVAAGLLFTLTVNAWFFPFYSNLLNWIFQASFSEEVKGFWSRSGGHFFSFIGSMLKVLYGPMAAILFISGLIRGRSFAKNHFWLKFGALAAAAFLPIFMGSLSYNGSYWFFFNGTYVGILGLIVWALGREGSFFWARMAIGTALAWLGFFGALRGAVVAPGNGTELPSCAKVVDALHSRLDLKRPLSMAVFSYGAWNASDPDTLDRWCMHAYALEQKFPIATMSPEYFGNESFEVFMGEMRTDSDYLIISPIGAAINPANSAGLVAFAQKLETLAASAAIVPYGFRSLGILEMANERKERLLILENLRIPEAVAR